MASAPAVTVHVHPTILVGCPEKLFTRLQERLASYGLDVRWHVSGQRFSESMEIPGSATVMVINFDFCDHSTSEAMSRRARQANLRILLLPQRWAEASQRLEQAGFSLIPRQHLEMLLAYQRGTLPIPFDFKATERVSVPIPLPPAPAATPAPPPAFQDPTIQIAAALVDLQRSQDVMAHIIAKNEMSRNESRTRLKAAPEPVDQGWPEPEPPSAPKPPTASDPAVIPPAILAILEPLLEARPYTGGVHLGTSLARTFELMNRIAAAPWQQRKKVYRYKCQWYHSPARQALGWFGMGAGFLVCPARYERTCRQMGIEPSPSSSFPQAISVIEDETRFELSVREHSQVMSTSARRARSLRDAHLLAGALPPSQEPKASTDFRQGLYDELPLEIRTLVAGILARYKHFQPFSNMRVLQAVNLVRQIAPRPWDMQPKGMSHDYMPRAREILGWTRDGGNWTVCRARYLRVCGLLNIEAGSCNECPHPVVFVDDEEQFSTVVLELNRQRHAARSPVPIAYGPVVESLHADEPMTPAPIAEPPRMEPSVPPAPAAEPPRADLHVAQAVQPSEDTGLRAAIEMLVSEARRLNVRHLSIVVPAAGHAQIRMGYEVVQVLSASLEVS